MNTPNVDYMVIFENPNNYKPQTLLNYLKNFVNHYYRTSEIYQSHPTIVLELNHITFELVPAKKDILGTVYISSPSSSYEEWCFVHSKNAELCSGECRELQLDMEPLRV